MRRQTIPLVLGLILGLFGTAMVMSYVRGVQRDAGRSGEPVTVYVAASEIAAGTSGAHVAAAARKTQMPRRYAPVGAITDPATIKDQTALERIADGETLTARMFGSAGGTRGSLAIPKGREAVSVSVPLDAAVAEYPRPGDRISVYATFKGATPVTIKIVSAVPVLATETRTRGATGASGGDLVLTLAVTGAEASQIVFGKQIGSLWFTLVPAGQTSPAVEPVTLPAQVSGESR
ncbi:MAG TPA: Flp pilus assembly protein CpaB [Actinomycetota bacterium]